MCLAQEHNTVTPVRLKNAAPQSQSKHSTIEQLCYQMTQVKIDHARVYSIVIHYIYGQCQSILMKTVGNIHKDSHRMIAQY